MTARPVQLTRSAAVRIFQHIATSCASALPPRRPVWHSREIPPLAVRAGVGVNRSGLTLLEVMIALVILGLVATGFLETFAGALRATADARTWAQALVYADAGQESVKIEGVARAAGTEVPLGGGFSRRITLRPWREGVTRATVTVTLPSGARYELERLAPAP